MGGTKLQRSTLLRFHRPSIPTDPHGIALHRLETHRADPRRRWLKRVGLPVGSKAGSPKLARVPFLARPCAEGDLKKRCVQGRAATFERLNLEGYRTPDLDSEASGANGSGMR